MRLVAAGNLEVHVESAQDSVGGAVLRRPGPVWRVVGEPLVRGAGRGPLTGHTVAVKDLFAVAGQRCGVGVRAFLAQAPVEGVTAPAVQMLLDAGADVVGIAQTDQFAYSIAGINEDYGTPPNPAAPGTLPGGSSSGPASAVALGQATIGLGTDTGGSVRVPASYQGLWGLRPTAGAVPRVGVHPLAPDYDTPGWIARDGEVLREIARVAGLGLGRIDAGAYVVDESLLDGCTPEVAAALSEAVAGLPRTMGAAGRKVTVGATSLPAADSLLEVFRVTQSAQAWRANGSWVEAHPGALAPAVRARFDWGRAITPAREDAAVRERDRLREAIDGALGDAILILPTASSPPPSLRLDPVALDRVRHSTLALCAIAGLTGRPALSVPLLSTPGGPVGLCVVGPRGSDHTLITVGLELAQAMRPVVGDQRLR